MLNFIVNAHSGRGRGQKTLKKIINYCYKNKVEYTVHLTSAAGHATRIARALCENNSHTIVAIGGDGTFNEVLNGLILPSHVTLGFIPSGRGNDFAKGTGIPIDPIKALKNILANRIKNIDYFTVGNKRCLNVAGTGLDIDVLQRVAGRQGKLTYIKSLLYCLRHFDPYPIEVTTEDGAVKEYCCIMAGVCNGTQIGGGIKLSPLSDTSDGLLNIMIMNMPPNRKFFRLVPKFVKGNHMDLPITTHFTAKSIKIRTLNEKPIQIDGEIHNNIDFDCHIIAGGLRTFDLT